MGDLVEARQVEARGDAGREERVRRKAVVVRPADDAAGHRDARALEVGLRRGNAQQEDAVTGLGQGRGAIDEVGQQSAVERGRDAVVRDPDGAHGRPKTDLAGQDDARTRARATEGEVAVHRDRVGDCTDRAVAEERGARADQQGTATDRAAGDGPEVEDGVVAEHQRAGVQIEGRIEGARPTQGQHARALFGQGQHTRALQDWGADDETRGRQAGMDSEHGVAGAEFEGSPGDDGDGDGRLIGRGHGVGGGQRELDGGRQGRVGHAPFVVEEHGIQGVGPDEIQVGAAQQRDAGGRGDLTLVVQHGHRGVGAAAPAGYDDVSRDQNVAAGRRVEIQSALIDESRAQEVVGDRTGGSTEGQRAAARLHEVHGAGERHVEVHRALVRIDIQVRTRRGERADRGVALQGDRAAVVRDDAHAEGDRGVDEREILVGAGGKTPAIGRMGARDGANRRTIIVITRAGGRIDVVTREIGGGIAAAQGVLLTHGDDAEGVAISGEGRTIRDCPATDEPIDKAGGAKRSAVELREADVGVLGETLAAKGVDPAVIQGGPAVEVHHRTHARRGDDEVADVDPVGRTHADIGVGVDLDTPALDVDAIKGQQIVDRTTPDEGQGAAGKRDGVGRRDPDRAVNRVETEVIEEERTLRETQASRAGERTRVTEFERAAADHGRTGVIAGRGQRGRGVARAHEAEAAGESAPEGAVVGRGEDRAGQASDRAAHAGQRVRAGEAADRLVLRTKIEDGARPVERDEG